ncbi:DUF6232 family protein [Dactylosporangium sp. CA-139066]|uniref:DUF6232 family protein n=1 Tax=Dactylosporangium sp. CA-139066 TaxID=3239930 RepID=UPI003D89B270
MRGPEVRISHAKFRVLGPEPREYAIADLRQLWVVEPDSGRPVVVLRVSCSGTAIVAAAVSFAETDLSHPAGWVCLLLAAGTVAQQVRVSRRRESRRYELWAFDRGRGRAIRLYATTSRAEFGKVRRALIRAIEWNEGLTT